MTLDQYGKIAAAEIAFYVPVLCVAFFIALKNGFSHKNGWILLFMFSLGKFFVVKSNPFIRITNVRLILVRIIGGAITIAYRTQSHPQTGLVVAAIVLSSVGLSPLILATKAFVTKV